MKVKAAHTKEAGPFFLSWCDCAQMRRCFSRLHFSPSRILANLRSLDLRFCRDVPSIEPISTLVHLVFLDLGWCERLTSLSPLRTLTALQNLDLGHIGYAVADVC
jgi:hypothetical protein